MVPLQSPPTPPTRHDPNYITSAPPFPTKFPGANHASEAGPLLPWAVAPSLMTLSGMAGCVT